MSKILKAITSAIPHICIALCLMMGVLIYINTVNTAMGFLRGNVFITALCTLCVVSLLTSVLAITRGQKVKNDDE